MAIKHMYVVAWGRWEASVFWVRRVKMDNLYMFFISSRTLVERSQQEITVFQALVWLRDFSSLHYRVRS